VGLLMMAAGVGALAAVPLSARLIDRPRLRGPTAVALVACGLPFIAIAGLPLLDVTLAMVVVWGVAMAVSDVATSSLLYRLLDTPMVPRVTGAIESSKLALEGVGALLAPVLASTIGIRTTLILAGLPLPVVVVAGWRVLHRVDATADDRVRILGLLHGVPSLESLAGRVVPLSAPAGAEVVRQGDPGDRFYVVRGGEADVLIDGFVVGTIAPGGYFGEKALLRDAPRTATVRARRPMDLLALSREDFLTALTGQSDTVAAHAQAATHVAVEPVHWSRRTCVQFLSRVSLLSSLDESTLRDLAAVCELERFSDGTVMVRQGDPGDRFFVLLDGRATVTVDGVQAAELQPGDQFGEIALLHDVPRRADVVASGDVTALTLGREAFVPAARAQMLQG
jgi:CRP-like cAMP-binding protein